MKVRRKDLTQSFFFKKFSRFIKYLSLVEFAGEHLSNFIASDPIGKKLAHSRFHAFFVLMIMVMMTNMKMMIMMTMMMMAMMIIWMIW